MPHWFAVTSALDYDRKKCSCGVAGLACSPWCSWASPYLFPPAPDLASPLHSPPTHHPRGPPPVRVHMTRAFCGVGRPALLPGQNTGFRLPVFVTTPVKKKSILILFFMVLWSLALAIINDSHLPVSTTCCYSESWWIGQNLGPISLQSQGQLGKSQIIADAQTNLTITLKRSWQFTFFTNLNSHNTCITCVTY